MPSREFLRLPPSPRNMILCRRQLRVRSSRPRRAAPRAEEVPMMCRRFVVAGSLMLAAAVASAGTAAAAHAQAVHRPR
jgi:hypothetical protein